MAIAAVVLNYRTANQTIAAVRSLQQSTTPVDHVVVVDNASADESAGRFRDELSSVDVLCAASNSGYAAGCNIGIREALRLGAARILILNPDVVVTSNAVAVLDQAVSHGAGDVVGPVLVERSRPSRIESGGITYSPVTGRMRHRLAGATRSSAASAAPDLNGVSGALMLVRREVFEAVGLFAEEFFYGFEDLDFCLRARAAGFRVACVSAAVVEHEGAASIGRHSPRRLYFAARNHLLLASRVGPQVWPIRIARAANIVALNVAHACLRANGSFGRNLGAVAKGVADHLKGKYGPDA